MRLSAWGRFIFSSFLSRFILVYLPYGRYLSYNEKMLNVVRKSIFFSALVFLSAVFLAFAQGVASVSVSGVPTRTLYRGLRDQNTNGEVTKLQQFLKSQSNVYPEGLVTGFFGALTEQAVQRFQKN